MRRYPRVFGSPAAKAQSRAAVCATSVTAATEGDEETTSVVAASENAPAEPAPTLTAGN